MGAYCVLNLLLQCLLSVLEKRKDLTLLDITITLGSVNTPLWDSESIKSDFEELMLTSSNVSNTILYMAEQPDSQIIEDLTLMPVGGTFDSISSNSNIDIWCFWHKLTRFNLRMWYSE